MSKQAYKNIKYKYFKFEYSLSFVEELNKEYPNLEVVEINSLNEKRRPRYDIVNEHGHSVLGQVRLNEGDYIIYFENMKYIEIYTPEEFIEQYVEVEE